jgi:class 3 adenylate cyclase
MDQPFQVVGLLFADVVGYSKLTEPQLVTFVTKVLPDLNAQVVDPHRKDFIDLNTWGDGLVAMAPDPYRLADFALRLRDFYRNRHWHGDGLPNLQCRIAVHQGRVCITEDPIRKTRTVAGQQVNMAARIEPVTDPGEIWVTEAFFHLIPPNQQLPFGFDALGPKELAKKFGSAHLYRLRRAWEPEGKAEVAPAPVTSSGSPAPASSVPEGPTVAHPQATKSGRGPLHPCKFHIMFHHYPTKNRWQTLADVQVEVIDGLPSEDWAKEAYLIPSVRALPELRDSKLLRADSQLLTRKRTATEKFIAEWKHHELDGAWFKMRTRMGDATGVYCLAYDLFLNASLTGG